MPNRIPSTSAVVVALALSYAALAGAELPAPPPTPGPADTPPVAVPAPAEQAPSAAEVARAKAEERRAAMTAERAKRYEELRARAAEFGLELPETPPWAATRPVPPAFSSPTGPAPEDYSALREQYQAMREKMRSLSPEEREAMRDEYWQQMRKEAAERGIEMPETPPWVEAAKRRQEWEARLEKYRRIIEQMSEEQIEAARAVFGRHPMMPDANRLPSWGPPSGHGYGQPGGHPGYLPYPDEPYGMGRPPMMPYPGTPGDDQGPPPPQDAAQ